MNQDPSHLLLAELANLPISLSYTVKDSASKLIMALAFTLTSFVTVCLVLTGPLQNVEALLQSERRDPVEAGFVFTIRIVHLRGKHFNK